MPATTSNAIQIPPVKSEHLAGQLLLDMLRYVPEEHVRIGEDWSTCKVFTVDVSAWWRPDDGVPAVITADREDQFWDGDCVCTYTATLIALDCKTKVATYELIGSLAEM